MSANRATKNGRDSTTSRIMLLILDGEEHWDEEFIPFAGEAVPPAIAVRLYEASRFSWRQKRETKESTLPLEEQINRGKRREVMRAINRLKRLNLIDYSITRPEGDHKIQPFYIKATGKFFELMKDTRSNNYTVGKMITQLRALLIKDRINIKISPKERTFKLDGD